MEAAMLSLPEATSLFDVCAEILALPGGGLATDLVVTLSTMGGPKGGLQRTTDAVNNIITFLMTQHWLFPALGFALCNN